VVDAFLEIAEEFRAIAARFVDSHPALREEAKRPEVDRIRLDA
jgi:hypothetical protein